MLLSAETSGGFGVEDVERGVMGEVGIGHGGGFEFLGLLLGLLGAGV